MVLVPSMAGTQGIPVLGTPLYCRSLLRYSPALVLCKRGLSLVCHLSHSGMGVLFLGLGVCRAETEASPRQRFVL